MSQYIIAYDLGTGGNKASIYDANGHCLSHTFVSYDTLYPAPGWHEQRPLDWWNAIVESTHQLLNKVDIDPKLIKAIGISGHSLGVVPLDNQGNLLLDSTPIWSDSRPDKQIDDFFKHISKDDWYMKTGNGFPPGLYSIFKIMWYRDNQPEMFAKIHKIIGTKDFINYKLTGKIATDFSYASGCGVYDLKNWKYCDDLIAASGIDKNLLPDILPSTEVLGKLTPDAASQLGLGEHVAVVAGGVDNSCMALGARAFKDGRIYNSLGSSSWIAVSSEKPLLDKKVCPYVFTHVVPGMFASAVAIFSAGSSFRWVRDAIAKDLSQQADETGKDVYDLMTEEAATSPAGSRKLLFNPSLAGGTSLDPSQNIRGAFIGLDLGHTRGDMLRASMEGVAMGLRIALDKLRKLTQLDDEMIVVGGGSKSKFWRQIYADVYKLDIVKTNIDQQAAALGAAAIAAVGVEVWDNFDKIDEIHEIENTTSPEIQNSACYDKLLPVFKLATEHLSQIGDAIAKLNLSGE